MVGYLKMAPREGDRVVCALFLSLFCATLLCERVESCVRYDRESLLAIRDSVGHLPTPVLLFSSSDITRESTEFSHGRTTSHRQRFRRRANRPPLPAIILSNVRSIKNKDDELLYQLKTKIEYREASVFCFTETWIDSSTPDTAVRPPAGYTLHRADRCPDLSGKVRGGGIAFLINNRWCVDSQKVNATCTPFLETLSVKAKPFYSPREFRWKSQKQTSGSPPGPSRHQP